MVLPTNMFVDLWFIVDFCNIIVCLDVQSVGIFPCNAFVVKIALHL